MGGGASPMSQLYFSGGWSELCLRDQISQTFPSVFAYSKQSKTGGGNGLETRLVFGMLLAILPCDSWLWANATIKLATKGEKST